MKMVTVLLGEYLLKEALAGPSHLVHPTPHPTVTQQDTILL